MQRFTFDIGGLVRHVKKNNGTGQVIARHWWDTVDKEGRVQSRTIYEVIWLDQEGVPTTSETERTLERSLRDAPEFEDQEAAQAWLDQQAEGGQWTAAVEDHAATAASAINDSIAGTVQEVEIDLAIDAAIQAILDGDDPQEV